MKQMQMQMKMMLTLLAILQAPSVSAQNQNARNILDLRLAVAAAADQGLNPAHYSGAVLDDATRSAVDPDWQAIVIRANALKLARDIVFGHNRQQHGADLDRDPEAIIDGALASGQLAKVLTQLQPADPSYAALVEELKTLRISATQADRTKILALRASLERWRWLPRSLPDERLWVDLPFYQLTFLRSGEVPQVHDVIIGKTEHPTEIFTAQVRGVIYDPAWQPPARLVRESVIPAIRDGRGTLLGFQLLRHGVPVALNSINWRGRTSLPPGYSVRQLPGPKNALGGVKLDMPNPYGIYLHDTPNKELFSKNARALSNGCVRVKDALGLAEKLLGPKPEMASQRVALERPITLYIVYMTARSTSIGITYAPDIYNLDASLVKSLDNMRPSKFPSLGSESEC
jgi:L,D-transpeptidase YcbB